MLEQFIQFIRRHDLFKKDQAVLLAVSGGLDSIVMTSLFRQAGFHFAIAHCNFGLRGNESEADQKFVAELAKELGVKFYSKKFKTEAYSKKHKLSIQEAARELRYPWFKKIAEQHDYKKIATAHHLDDSIETFFINLLRGTGIKGLTGISVKNNGIIRPLLFAQRREVEAFAKFHKIKWREDSSNQSGNYLRNRIRQQLIPVLLELQPSFAEKMKDNFEHFKLASLSYDNLLTTWKNKYLRKDKSGSWSIRISSLQKESFPEAVLSSIFHSIGIFDADMHSMMEKKVSGKIVHGGDYRILRNRDQLVLEKKKPTKRSLIRIPENSSEVRFETGILRLQRKRIHASARFSTATGIHNLDADNIRFPLVLRSWKPGDYFYPLGMNHRRKLSDFFIDKKLSVFEKENCKVLLSGKDIICILGHRIDDRYKVKPETKNIIRLKYMEHTR